jgi:hypothetical protein
MQETPAKTQKAAVDSAGDELQVSRYDRASSLLLALLIVVGAVAVLLFVLWLTAKITAPPPKAGNPHFVDLVRENGENGGNRRPAGGTTQLDTPSDDEPMFGKDNKTSGVQEELKRMDVAALSKKTHLDDPDADVPTLLGSRGNHGGRHKGNGDGDGLGNKTGRRPGDPAPPARNWEVLFSKNTLDAYARQLDFFKIELGVLLPDNKIAYVCNLTKPKPDSRTIANPAATERRYYLTWRSGGEMQQADQELLARAGIDVGDSLIVKFLPREIEDKLAELERGRAGADKRPILMTRFGVQPDGAGFKFVVLGQSYKR